jgi:integrase
MVARTRRSPGDGSIFQRADGRYIDRLVVNGRRLQVSDMTRRGAAAKLTELRRKVDRGAVPDERRSLADYLAWWQAEMRNTLAPRSRDKDAQRIRSHILPALGGHRLGALTPAHLQSLQNALLRRGLTETTVSGVMTTLGVALNDAVRLELIERNPMNRVRVVRERPADVRPLPPVEARAILDAFRGHRFEAAVVLALTLALRQGEILGLRWSDITPDLSALRLAGALKRVPREARAPGQGNLGWGDTKTPKSARALPLPLLTVEALQRRRAAQEAEREAAGSAWEETGYVFTVRTGGPVNPIDLGIQYRRRMRGSGLPYVPFRNLRAGAASLLLASGVPPTVVMEIMGHASPKLTMSVYNRMPADAVRRAVEQMDTLLGREGTREGTDNG